LAEIDRRHFLFLVHESSTCALGIMGALASRLRDDDELVAGSSGSSGADGAGLDSRILSGVGASGGNRRSGPSSL
jgi:hypothetical protein